MAETDPDKQDAARLGRALAALRARAGLSQAQAGDNYGTTGQGWAKYENGKAPSIFKPEVQRRLAEALGASVMDLMMEAGRPPLAVQPSARPEVISQQHQAGLPIRDRVQAGAWLMADDNIQTLPKRFPALPDPRYAHAYQWLSEVQGDSMNAYERGAILEGDLALCVELIGSGLHPRSGDLVEVMRTRFDGSERELTIKEVEVTQEGMILWPRSTNTRWSKALDLRQGAEQEDGVEVTIRGIVLHIIRRLS